MLQTVMLILLSWTPHFLYAETDISAAQGFYQEGLRAFQAGQYDEAEKKFQDSLKADPESTYSLYNWGLTQLKLGKKGAAAAAWRKALFINPSFAPAEKGLEFITPQLSSVPFTQSMSAWENYRSLILSRLSLEQMLGAGLVFLLIAGHLLLRYWGQRRQAFADEKPLPPFPSIGVGLMALFILSITIAVTKTVDHARPRATVIQETELRTGPVETDTSLLTLTEGLEVIVRQARDGWAQVSFPGGMTGWVPQSALFHTSGKNPW